jgi:hypothetical protein
MKLIRVIQSKIVKKDNKYQVQSEKGKNLGTYDTKEQAEKRLKQVEMFKHMKSSMSAAQVENLWNNRYDYSVYKIDYDDIYMIITDEDEVEHKLMITLDYKLGSFRPETKGKSSPYLADTPEEYYGNKAYYEDFKITKIIVSELDGQQTNIEIPLDSDFANDLQDEVEEHYKFIED